MTDVLYIAASRRSKALPRMCAHGLKNPLTSLRSAVETLPLAKSPESHARLLDVISTT